VSRLARKKERTLATLTQLKTTQARSPPSKPGQRTPRLKVPPSANLVAKTRWSKLTLALKSTSEDSKSQLRSKREAKTWLDFSTRCKSLWSVARTRKGTNQASARMKTLTKLVTLRQNSRISRTTPT